MHLTLAQFARSDGKEADGHPPEGKWHDEAYRYAVPPSSGFLGLLNLPSVQHNILDLL